MIYFDAIEDIYIGKDVFETNAFIQNKFSFSYKTVLVILMKISVILYLKIDDFNAENIHVELLINE